jgi:acyl dehydratase
LAMYFADFTVGDQFTTPARTVTESDVMLYAGLSGDFNPLHTDAESAKLGPFGQRIAHGPLGFSILMGLLGRLGQLDGTAIAMLGINEWRFVGPIFFGDTIHGVVTVEELRESRDESRGILIRRVELVKQTGDVVQRGLLPVMVKRRQAEGKQ